MVRRKSLGYSYEFRQQIINLYKHGKARNEIIIEYNLSPLDFDEWVYQEFYSEIFEKNKEKTNKQIEKYE